MWEVGSVVQRGLAAVVESIEGDLVLQEDVDHYILAVVTGNMQGSAAIGIDSIRLWVGGVGGGGINGHMTK